jgi:hypothetical protein
MAVSTRRIPNMRGVKSVNHTAWKRGINKIEALEKSEDYNKYISKARSSGLLILTSN